MIAALLPLITLSPMVVTGDEFFDAFFTLIFYFGCAALSVALVCSLFRLVVVVGLFGLLMVAGAEAFTFTDWRDCGDDGTVKISHFITGLSAPVGFNIDTSTEADGSGSVFRGVVAVGAAPGSSTDLRCSGYVRVASFNNFTMTCGQVCVMVAPGSSDRFTKRFWMAASGVLAAAFLVMAAFRGIR